jgi:ribosome-associated protein
LKFSRFGPIVESPRSGGHQEHEALTSTIQIETAVLPSPPVKGSLSDTGKLVRNVLHGLEDAKAEDIVSIDLRGKTSFGDMMFVASGRSTVHVGAIADRVIKACKDAGLATPRVEGIPNCDWVLVDANDVIVHIFRPEVRQFYNLEKLWGGDRPAERGARATA